MPPSLDLDREHDDTFPMHFLFALLLSTASLAHPFDHLAEELARNSALVDASQWPGIQLDVRYASTNNFTGHNVYGPYHSCFLHREAGEQLQKALAKLKAAKPLWKLRVFDCLRPVRAQAQLFAVVQGTPNERYVLDPAYGSLHSYGFAMDVSLSDDKGTEVDMGTRFDYMGEKGEPQYEQDLLRSGGLSWAQYQNRELLRSIMAAGGWRAISTEWWHFDALDGGIVRANYKPIP